MKYVRILTLLALVTFVSALAAPAQAARSGATRRSSNSSVKATPTPEVTPALTEATETNEPPVDTAKSNEETPKTEKISKPAGMNPTDTMFAGSDIKLKIMRGDDIEIDPTSGTITILGNAYIETDQFTLKGVTVRKLDKRTIFATGNPVHIEMPGKDTTNKATAKRVTYNLETRKMRFEGDPIVNVIDAEKRTQFKADIIEYNQGQSGLGAVHMKPLKGSNNQPEIKTFYNNAGAETPKQSPKGVKVNPGNAAELLKIPSPDIGG